MLTTQVYLQNNLDLALPISTGVSPALDASYWGASAGAAGPVEQSPAYWTSRSSGITDGDTWVFSIGLTLGGTPVSLQVKLTGTWLDSDIWIRVTAGAQDSGWSSDAGVGVRFTGADGGTYNVAGAFLAAGPTENDDVRFSVAATALPQVDHVVVLMMENRSLDNLLGWIYDGTAPAQVLPAGSPPRYDGLATGSYANAAAGVGGGQPVPVARGTTPWTVNGHTLSEFNVPNPDPGEEFADVAAQIGGGMGGFLANYLEQMAAAGGPDDSARQIMETYSPDQVPVITALATGYAVSDAWYASVPSQTWPNRYFLLSGTAGGNTNNSYLSLDDANTVFDVLGSQNVGWAVYSDNAVSLVKAMYWRYWDDESNFGGIDAFLAACRAGNLPAFTFLEPSFGVDMDDYKVSFGTDASYHPPYDVRPAEQLLAQVHQAIQASPSAERILFVVLFDEHGGTFDHVEPPMGAAPPMPYPVATDGSGFTFDRFGVRVPAIVVSPLVKPGTVFRSPTGVPFDHTSILATVREWLGLQVAFREMLPSPRIAAAPTLVPLLEAAPVAAARPVPTPLPTDPAAPVPPDGTALNPIQRTLAVAAALRAAGRVPTADHFAEAAPKLRTVGDLKAALPSINAAAAPAAAGTG